ncbi:3566_t:CDS:2, partial [Racocetra persica]
MPLDLRKLLKNYFLLDFVLFGASFKDFIKPILDNIRQLQSRKIINILEKEIWLISGLGFITANLPQDRYLQLLQDAYHALSSKATYLIDITLKYLNTNREVVEAKLLKLAFSTTITNNTYKELRNIFENLPNVHVNVYLLQHARIFATLVNTSVGVKEMVYRTYKNIVPHINYKNIELDLLRRYNTSFALTHLFD